MKRPISNMKGQNKANQVSSDWLLSAVHRHDVFSMDPDGEESWPPAKYKISSLEHRDLLSKNFFFRCEFIGMDEVTSGIF